MESLISCWSGNELTTLWSDIYPQNNQLWLEVRVIWNQYGWAVCSQTPFPKIRGTLGFSGNHILPWALTQLDFQLSPSFTVCAISLTLTWKWSHTWSCNQVPPSGGCIICWLCNHEQWPSLSELPCISPIKWSCLMGLSWGFFWKIMYINYWAWGWGHGGHTVSIITVIIMWSGMSFSSWPSNLSPAKKLPV